MPDNPAPSHFSTSKYKSTLFETKMACIENMSRIQHRQLNYRSHTCHNCDMLIMKFDLWWPELSEVPQNPASIPSATSLAREWLAEALFSTQYLDPIWLVSWWVGVPGRDSGMTLLLTCAPRRSIVLQFFWHVDTRPISPFLFFFNSTFYLCIIIVIFYLMYLIH